MICPACREEIDDDSRFCDACGFRLSPIPVEALRQRAQTSPPVQADQPIPLTKVKRTQSEVAPAGMMVHEPQRMVPPLSLSPALALPAVPPANTAAAPADVNSRKFRRFPLNVEVSYNSDHNFFTGFIKNIGEGGLFVATHIPARIGEVIEITFSVPGMNRICTALCTVRWTREYNASVPDTVPGMGLQFKQLDPDVRTAIDLFIGHREPIFYDD